MHLNEIYYSICAHERKSQSFNNHGFGFIILRKFKKKRQKSVIRVPHTAVRDKINELWDGLNFGKWSFSKRERALAL